MMAQVDNRIGERKDADSSLPTQPRLNSAELLIDAKWHEPAAGVLIDGKYRVTGPLGQGGMGTVLLAVDERLQREVAIKFIRPESVASPSAHQRFLVEARAMARIKHPCVVEIYAFGELEKAPYFVMEYVHGISLAGWLDRFLLEDRLPPLDDSLNFLDQLCRGVSAIHQGGALHGDLKPSNVLIGPASRIAIVDMGLCRVFDDSGNASDHPMAGTPAYLAPEFARSDLSPDLLQRSDVFALGVIAYEMLTGKLPWQIDTYSDMIRVHAGKKPQLPSVLRPDLTTAFDGPVLRALHVDPQKRTASAEDIRKDLLAARQSLVANDKPLRILIADDDPDFLALAKETLAHGFPGAELKLVHNGRAALRACDRKPADLVVMDLDMPGMNGVELTAALRTQHNMPIVVVTASGGAPDWRLLQALGATGFMVKPIDPYALITLARKAVAQSSDAAPAST